MNIIVDKYEPIHLPDPIVRDQEVIGHLFAKVNIDMTGKSNSF